jgi:hypothetical protein
LSRSPLLSLELFNPSGLDSLLLEVRLAFYTEMSSEVAGSW